MNKTNKNAPARKNGLSRTWRENTGESVKSSAKNAKSGDLLRLKIVLMDSMPKIWREIIVSANDSFFALNVAIQNVFGWTDSHLHQFFTANPYKTNALYPRITVPNPEFDEGEEVIDGRKTEIGKYLNKIGEKVYYEYDFGDSWMHEIKVLEIFKNDGKIKMPAIIGGENAAPPEDCGGIGGYYDLLKVIKNPKHPDHEDMMNWLGIETPGEFDPASFDIRAIKFSDPKKWLSHYDR